MTVDNERLKPDSALGSSGTSNGVSSYINLKKRVDDLVSTISWRNKGVNRVVDAVEELQMEALPELYKYVDDLIEKQRRG